jgi:hypothetical protein
MLSVIRWSGPAFVVLLVGHPGSRLDAQTRCPHVIRWYEATAAVAGVALLSVLDQPTQNWVQSHRTEGSG